MEADNAAKQVEAGPCPMCAAGCCLGTSPKYTHGVPSHKADATPARSRTTKWSQIAAGPPAAELGAPGPASAREGVPSTAENVPPTASSARNLEVLRGRAAPEPRVRNTGNMNQTPDMLFRNWRFFPEVEKNRSLGYAKARFSQQALSLASGEIGVMQETISLLSTEGGLKRIGELLNERGFDGLPDARFVNTFRSELVPFFCAISHRKVLASAMLEGRLSTIYNYLFGNGGVRAVVVFADCVRYLEALGLTKAAKAEAPEDELLHYHSAWESILEVLGSVIVGNGPAAVTEGLQKVVARLTTTADNVATPLSRLAVRYMQRVARGMTRTVPAAKKRTDRQRAELPTFVLRKELPGDLSDDGPRHDNDFADITQISLMPTIAEIHASRSEYLPLPDPSAWHLSGLSGMLDRQFRLLREDTVGQLRDAAKVAIDRLENPQAYEAVDRRHQQGARTFVYSQLEFLGFQFDAHRGLQIALAFDQPYDLRYKTATQRREWWENSRRMTREALMCLVAPGSVLFCMLTSQEVRKITPIGHAEDQSPTMTRGARTLHGEPNRAYITARLINVGDEEIKQLMAYVSGALSAAQKQLVEFPGVLLPAFQSTLEALQDMTKTQDLPFAELVTPVDIVTPGTSTAEVAPPAYSTEDGFCYNLSGLSIDSERLQLAVDNDFESSVEEIKLRTTLDDAQATAFVSALTRSLALIQGPPGTGKSYTGIALMRALTANKKTANLGPIVTVAQTNHALDQLLEELLGNGIGQVIRMGFGSKSDRLANLQLQKVVDKATQTRAERQEWGKTKGGLDQEAREINNLLHQISQVGNPKTIQAYLDLNFPEHGAQLFGGIDEEGFQTVHYGPAKTLAAWLHQLVGDDGSLGRPIEDLFECNILETSSNERRRLWEYWMDDQNGQLHGKLRIALESYHKLKGELTKISNELNGRVLSQADVIGITTAGLARSLALFRKLGSKVLLVEEAGEILEAHTLTALLPTLEHVILIGDHQQLRPQIQNHQLSSENPKSDFAMDISLFERLVHPSGQDTAGLPYTTLEMQRRMATPIANLIRSTLYPNLLDHADVANYPEVAGFHSRLFWWSHTVPENAAEALMTSHVNSHEVEMVAGIVSHLIRQQVYKPSDIAVLTPYLGQLRALKLRLRNSFAITLDERDEDELALSEHEGVLDLEARPTATSKSLLQSLRLATVDNFQGEEAKVVILSLVRSNEAGKSGFLKTPNRINVALSRAQHGMIICGNRHTAEHGSEMWRNVLRLLEADGCVGDFLQLTCLRHPDNASLHVKTPDDFTRLAPEAGCNEPCSQALQCGHPCSKKCHPQPSHDAEKCLQPSNKIFSCGHPTNTLCGEPIPEQCSKLISGISVSLPCGHTKALLPCYQQQDPSLINGDVMVEKQVPGCLHTIKTQCCDDAAAPKFVCLAACGTELQCGHSCSNPCFRCHPRSDGEVLSVDHGQCQIDCGQLYPDCNCKHTSKCHEGSACPPCGRPCDTRCVHTACDGSHAEACKPCPQACTLNLGCPHGQQVCSSPCGAPCTTVPCSRRSEIQLPCGHQSPAVCGSTQALCFACLPEGQRKDGMRENDLQRDPFAFLKCGHFIRISELDNAMHMSDYYELDNAGRPNHLKAPHLSELPKKVIGCPTCGGSLQDTARYGRVVRGARLNVSATKIVTWTHKSIAALLSTLAEELKTIQSTVATSAVPHAAITLVGEPGKQLQIIGELDQAMNTCRYERLFALRNNIMRLLTITLNLETPFIDLQEVNSKADNPAQGAEISIPRIGGLHLQAASLLLQCEAGIITDMVVRGEKKQGQDDKKGLTVDFKLNRERCMKLISAAAEAKMCLQEIEGKVLWVQYAVLESRVAVSEELFGTEYLDAEAAIRLGDVEEAASSFNDNAAVAGMEVNVQHARDTVNALRKVGEMAVPTVTMSGLPKIDSRAGRWYRCTDSHVFATDDASMEDAVCYYCGQGVQEKTKSVADESEKSEEAVDGDLIEMLG